MYPSIKHIVNISANTSAIGIANQAPITPKIPGNIKRETTINPNVRKSEIIAEIFPFDSAVNNAEEKILHPENRKLKAKIENPVFIISNTL